jgi:hypothetical protein
MRLNGIAVTAFLKSRLFVEIIPDGALRYDGKQLQRGHFERFASQFVAARVFECCAQQR